MNRKILFIPAICFILLSACQKPVGPKNYLHLAHIRTLDTLEQGIDPRIEAMDFSKYDLLLLGGDLTEESSEEEKTLQYLDGIFDLGAPTTLWALGNHDNAQNALVSKYTERPITYTANHDGITFVVLYTQEEQDWICTISGEQLEMLQSVTDTISESSHLIVMTHKLVWIMDNPEMVQHQGNSRYDWSCNYRIHRNNWNTDILPRLREVQERGVQVICLAGDVGNNVRTFEEHTSDGIVYLASGIPVEEKFKAESRMLEFKHWPGEDSLTWVFVPVL